MSDFEQWFGGSKYTQVVYPSAATKQIALDGWNAAIASMQGEAVGEIKGKSLSGAPLVIIKDWDLPDGAELFTYPPDAAAEIARLQKELEKARKDALEEAANSCVMQSNYYSSCGSIAETIVADVCTESIRALKDGE